MKSIIMSNSFLYFSVSILLLVLFVLCLKWFLGGCTPRKVLRGIDNALSKSQLGQLFLLIFFIVFAFTFILFLSAGITSLYQENYDLPFWSALGHFFNPGSFGKEDGIADGWIFTINLFGMVLMTGLLISVLSNLLERRVDNLKSGRVHYKYNNHFVIIGYDKMSISLIKQLTDEIQNGDRGRRNRGGNIVLQTIQDVPTVRHELFSYLNKDMEKQVVILNGNRNSREDLEKLSLEHAQKLFIFGENQEYDHDSLNVECLKKINKILGEKNAKSEKPCYVLFENQSTYAILQQQDLFDLLNENQHNDTDPVIPKLEFLPFNCQELWAQKVFVDNAYNCPEDKTENIQYQPLDREGIGYDSEKTVHLVILGMSKMGIALGVQASHSCHFPNFIRDKKLKTKITFIDEQADREMHFLQGRYRHLFKEIDYSYEDINKPAESFDNLNEPNKKGSLEKYTDIEWHFIKGRIEDPKIQQKLIGYSSENSCLTIAVCLNHPAAAIACGLYLPDEIYHKNIQILIKQDTPHSILSMLKKTIKYKNVKLFGMLDNSLDFSKTDDDIPIIIKYVYDLYRKKQQQATVIPPLEDLREKWKTLKTVKKWSNRFNADSLVVKQRSFHIQGAENLESEKILLLAEVEHNRWNIEELLLGYRPTTEDEKTDIGNDPKLKDSEKEKFIHNDICPFDKIPDLDIEPEEDGNKIKNPQEYDICLSKAIPMIIQYRDEKIRSTTH